MARANARRRRPARLVGLTDIRESRGRLVAAETGRGLPFVPKRCFIILDVPSRKVRGEHAHKRLEQFLVCVRGGVTVLLDDGRRRRRLRLRSPARGVHIPPMVWAAQYDYSPDAVLVVFASQVYDARDYIRDYDEFLRRVHRRGR